MGAVVCLVLAVMGLSMVVETLSMQNEQVAVLSVSYLDALMIVVGVVVLLVIFSCSFLV
jgi:hypothetical protein